MVVFKVLKLSYQSTFHGHKVDWRTTSEWAWNLSKLELTILIGCADSFSSVETIKIYNCRSKKRHKRPACTLTQCSVCLVFINIRMSKKRKIRNQPLPAFWTMSKKPCYIEVLWTWPPSGKSTNRIRCANAKVLVKISKFSLLLLLLIKL